MAGTTSFKDRGILSQQEVATANTNRDGTGTIAIVATGKEKGTIIERVIAKAQGTTTAGMIRLYIDDGSNVRLIHEIPVEAITPDASTESWSGTWVPTTSGIGELILPEGHELQASTHNAETFNIFAIGGDF